MKPVEELLRRMREEQRENQIAYGNAYDYAN